MFSVFIYVAEKSSLPFNLFFALLDASESVLMRMQAISGDVLFLLGNAVEAKRLNNKFGQKLKLVPSCIDIFLY